MFYSNCKISIMAFPSEQDMSNCTEVMLDKNNSENISICKCKVSLLKTQSILNFHINALL